MFNIRVKGRNDFDLPDSMVVTLDRESGEVTFKFDGVIRAFTITESEATALFNIVKELRNEQLPRQS